GVVDRLQIVELEPKTGTGSFSEGNTVGAEQLSEVIRSNLRDEIWCKLERLPHFFLHFGYDFYMYIGSHHDLPESVRFAVNTGLFVEECLSPYFHTAAAPFRTADE